MTKVITKGIQKRLRKQPGRYHHGNLSQALVIAAERYVASTRSTEFTIREIAAAAGVTHTAAYRHFTDKTALMAAVATRGFEELNERLVTATNAPGNVVEKLTAAAVAYAEFAVEKPGTFALIWHASLKPFTDFPELWRQASRTTELVYTLLRSGQEDGLFGAGDLREAAVSLWSSIHGHAVLVVDRQLGQAFAISDLRTSVSNLMHHLIYGLVPRR